MAIAPTLFDPINHLPFAGADYDEQRDRERLTKQIDRIRAVSLELGWATVQKLAEMCRRVYPSVAFPENSVSAQLRNLKKVGYLLERRHLGGGLFEYRILDPKKSGAR